MCEENPSLTKKAYRMSRLDTNGMGPPPGAMDDRSWPFMCVAIGFTKDAVDALRSGILNKYINRTGSVMAVLQDMHHAQFHAMCELLKEAPTEHHARHLASLRSRCAKKATDVLKAYWEAGKAGSGSSGSGRADGKSKWAVADDEPTFAGLQDVVVRDEDMGMTGVEEDEAALGQSSRQRNFKL